jgi:uncharacterized phage protein gp47/JayE
MTPSDYAAQLDSMDLDFFISRALDNVPDTVDKREGSIIYDALAPVAYDYVQLRMFLQQMLLMSFTETATDDFLDARGQEKGLTRNAATYAQVSATMTDSSGAPALVEVGDRFSSVGAEAYIYDVTDTDDQGIVKLTCETAGTEPNHYVGTLLPVTAQDQFGAAAITDVTVPARDAEADDDFRARILATSNSVAYGGNVADYQRMIVSLGTVGAVQIYPTWAGGGTVKLVIIDNDFEMPSADLVTETQQAIDPTDAHAGGYGLAPIGHTVTVVAPTARTIPVTLTLDVDATTDMATATAAAKVAIATYFDKTRRKWGTLANGSREYALSVYRSQIMGAVLGVAGVVNVTDITLEGKDADVQLVYTRSKSELPVLGEVTVNAATHTA